MEEFKINLLGLIVVVIVNVQEFLNEEYHLTEMTHRLMHLMITKKAIGLHKLKEQLGAGTATYNDQSGRYRKNREMGMAIWNT